MPTMKELAVQIAEGKIPVRSEYDPSALKTMLRERDEKRAGSKKKMLRGRRRLIYYVTAIPPLVLLALILQRFLGGG